MHNKSIIFAVFFIIALIGVSIFLFVKNAKAPSIPQTVPAPNNSTANNTKNPQTFVPPISNAASRVTKKPFGIFVTPQNSPVSPEKFTGFHTGTDFETFSSEQNLDVQIFSACEGKLLEKRIASGYGGVVVQACKINNQDVTIVYGHLKLASVSPAIGQTLKPGDQIGVLGKGFSTETDGERKHLHFAIHKGASINILGYVQNQNDLSNWLDPMQFLK